MPEELDCGRNVELQVNQIAVFVDDCRAHGCPTHGIADHVRRDARVAAVIAYDGAVNRLLDVASWTVYRAWEHDDPRRTAEWLTTAVARAGSGEGR